MAAKKNGNASSTKGDFDNVDTLVLFPNPKKETGDNRPDFTGKVNWEGEERWISVWKRESKNGQKFLSGVLNDPVEAKPKNGGAFSKEKDTDPFA